MGKADWSLDHFERELAAGSALLGHAERAGRLGTGESGALADGILQCMNGALIKVSESLKVQNRLRRELVLAREDFQHAQAVQAERIKSLEAEVSALRQALGDERRRVQLETTRRSPNETRHSPPEDHLSRPLVLRSQQGDFLGVTDRLGQTLSLGGFLRLVEGASGGPSRSDRIVASCWDTHAGSWSLTVCITSKAFSRRCYVLETQVLRTPIGNMVTLLAHIFVDGSPVPSEFVVQMFRHLRESFQEE